jgi:hypothetical protein
MRLCRPGEIVLVACHVVSHVRWDVVCIAVSGGGIDVQWPPAGPIVFLSRRCLVQ